MRNFSYNKEPQEQGVEEILKYHKKRLFKQQLVFTCIFVALLVVGACYLYRRTVYTYYDGYVKLDQNHIRAIDDIFVLRIYPKTGDRVQAGDTLFSYVLIDNILEQQNVNAFPGIVTDLHRLQIQAELAAQELPVLRTRLEELAKRIRNEEHDVYYGLSDNTQRMLLEAEKRELEARIREQQNRVALYRRMAGRASQLVRGSGYGSNFIPYTPNERPYEGLVKYTCAPQDGIVTDVWVAEETIVFHKEEVIDLQHDDYKACNLGVMAYVPSSKVKYLQRRGEVEVIVNDDITLRARLSLLGIRVEEIPKHLVSNFSHDVDAVIAYFTFLPRQEVPFWVLTDNLPVRVRTNNFEPADSVSSEHLFYIRDDNEVVPVDTAAYDVKPVKSRRP